MKNLILILVLIPASFIGNNNAKIKGEELISIRILYDNTMFSAGTKSDWGFSCLIDGTEKTILFDTGMDGKILLGNIDSLGIDLNYTDLIIISHNHLDHTGGLNSVLGRKSDVSVYMGASFFPELRQIISNYGATPVKVDEPVRICKNVHSTGELQGAVNEQSLILDTEKGLVIITGCAHTGILNILKKAKEILNKNIYIVMGGFHLLESSETEINNIIAEFKTLGVEKCGATHCTGERAIALFKKAYGENFIPMGTGMVIQVPKLTTSIKGLDNEKSDKSKSFILGQNYPNPFNPATVIRYSVPDPCIVSIKVYDILGNERSILVHGLKQPGNYDVRFNGSNLSSGVYFYRMQAIHEERQAGSFISAKKFVLLK